jgi:hypothetical protein
MAVIGRLTSAYSSWPCHAGTVQVFWDALGDLPQEALERAAVAHVAQESAWPTAAALRRLAKPRELSGGLTASEAWEEMYRHRHAHTRNPAWSSPAVERAARAVNWNDPDWLTEQLPTIRAQFERYFNAIEARDAKEQRYVEADKLLAFACGSGGTDDGPRRLFGQGGGTNGA